MKKVFLFFVILFVAWTACASAAPVGRITHVEGRVDVLKTGKNMAVPVTLGAPVDVGDVYRAKTASKAEITFNNRNLLRIAANTRAEIKEYMVQGERSSGIVRLHRGKVQAVSGDDLIRKATAFVEGNRFEVHTQNAVAGVRGTNMLVGFEKGATVVIFLAGQGYLYNPNRPDVITPISVGNVSIVAGGSGPTTPRPAGNMGNTFMSGGSGVSGSDQAGLGSALGGSGGGSGMNQFRSGMAYAQQQQQGLQLQQQQQQQTQSSTTSGGGTGVGDNGTALYYGPPTSTNFSIGISGVYGTATGSYTGILGATPITMTLTWGASPRDLDSRLWVPNSGGGYTLVNYSNSGSSTSFPFAWLNQDITSGYGPETITIVQNLGGRYYYSVNNYSESPAISTSGAHLVVTDSSGHTYTYDIPNYGSATDYYWNVFFWQNNRLYSVNSIGGENLSAAPVGLYTANLSGAGYLWSGSATPISASGTYTVLSPTDRYTMNNLIPVSTTADGGAYAGMLGGILGRGVAGALYALYIDPAGKAGILQGSFSGSTNSNAGTWAASGNLQAIAMSDTLGILPQNLGTSINSIHFGTSAADTAILNGSPMSGAYTYEVDHQSIPGGGFGVWKTYLDGSVTGTMPNNWTASFDHFDTATATMAGQEIVGTLWSDNAINGKAAAYGASVNTGTTWVAMGDVVGTFDASNGFTMVSLGASIETSLFLQMASTVDGLAKLQQLNFPCAEVGKVTMSGSAVESFNVTMADVKFFSFQGGQAPLIWATGGVTGSYSGNPQGQTAALSGGGLQANFTMTTWDTGNGKWLSSITNGRGNLSGGAQPYSGYINFRGAGAGTFGGGSFAGTAAGVAKAAAAP